MNDRFQTSLVNRKMFDFFLHTLTVLKCFQVVLYIIIGNNCNNCSFIYLFIFYCLTVFIICLFQIEIKVILSKIKNKKKNNHL